MLSVSPVIVLVAVAAVVCGATGWWTFARTQEAIVNRRQHLRSVRGTATRAEVRRAAGERGLLARSGTLRPGLTAPTAADVGHRLGRSRGADCWASVEDSVVILGPPRSGKGLHLVVPMILDAPGAVVTTSTRPDNLTATLWARRRIGPVAVFDPQQLANGIEQTARWSPMRGCERAQVAMLRARALTAGVGNGTTDATFWQASAEQAVRCLLHAAALGEGSVAELYRWSLSPVLASRAVSILTEHPGAATGWSTALNSILAADVKQRDSVWAMVGLAFSALADPAVLDAVSPEPGEGLDPETFLRERGTLFLIGTSTGSGAIARLVAALVEDIVEVARQLAAGSPGGRLDPPATVVLDEAANYRLPSLASLMSEGGGSGICTVVVLQSLAQARAVWGEHEAAGLWEAAIVKLILGGGSNARDLEDLSKLIGTRTDRHLTVSTGGDGRKSRTVSEQQIPILEPGRLRLLPFGTAVLLLRSAQPIMLTLRRWPDRPDASRLASDQQQVEALLGRIRDTAGP